MSDANVTIGNGNLSGPIATDDSVSVLITTGATEGTLVAGTPVEIFSLADLMALGVTLGNNPLLIKDVTEFYSEAPANNPLFIIAVPSTMTLTQMADITNASGLVKALDFAKGSGRIVGLNAIPQGSPTITAGLNADVATALVKIQATAAAYAAKEMPFRAVMAGLNFSGAASALTDLNTAAYNRCGVVIGDTVTGTGACVGLVLGRLAKCKVQEKISKVRLGALNIIAAFIGATTVDSFSGVAAIDAKNYITLRTRPKKTGWFFTSDKAATSSTDDYAFLCTGRIIDKAAVLAYQVYVEEVDDEVPTDDAGLIDEGFARSLEQKMENQVQQTMIAKGELVKFKASVDRKSPVVLSSTTNVALAAKRKGYNSFINILLGFSAN